MSSFSLILTIFCMAMAAVYCEPEPSFLKPVTRVIHYHPEPVAHFVHSRHLHVEPVHYIHPHHHHHHHEDVIVDHHHHDIHHDVHHHDHADIHDLHDHHHWH